MAKTRALTATLALTRLAFGAALVARPERVASGWLGRDARRAAVTVAIRAVGVRDIAISAGTLAALSDPQALRRWVAGAMIADLGDVAATLAVPGRALPANARWGTAVLGGGSAAAGAALLAALGR